MDACAPLRFLEIFTWCTLYNLCFKSNKKKMIILVLIFSPWKIKLLLQMYRDSVYLIDLIWGRLFLGNIVCRSSCCWWRWIGRQWRGYWCWCWSWRCCIRSWCTLPWWKDRSSSRQCRKLVSKLDKKNRFNCE